MKADPLMRVCAVALTLAGLLVAAEHLSRSRFQYPDPPGNSQRRVDTWTGDVQFFGPNADMKGEWQSEWPR